MEANYIADEFLINRWLHAEDLPGDTTLTIADIRIEWIGDNERPVMYFQETAKNLRLNNINSRSLVSMYGRHMSDWIGKQVTLYPTEGIYNNQPVPAIRVRMPEGERGVRNERD